jgi:hypothetical protein
VGFAQLDPGMGRTFFFTAHFYKYANPLDWKMAAGFWVDIDS